MEDSDFSLKSRFTCCWQTLSRFTSSPHINQGFLISMLLSYNHPRAPAPHQPFRIRPQGMHEVALVIAVAKSNVLSFAGGPGVLCLMSTFMKLAG